MIRRTKPGLVALYDIRPGNGAGPFLQINPGARTGQYWTMPVLACMPCSVNVHVGLRLVARICQKWGHQIVVEFVFKIQNSHEKQHVLKQNHN